MNTTFTTFITIGILMTCTYSVVKVDGSQVRRDNVLIILEEFFKADSDIKDILILY